MAERYGFFNAVNQGGTYDRVYMAEDFAEAMSSFISTGVFDRDEQDLQVLPPDVQGMQVKVNSGRAWINGYWYVNDSPVTYNVDVSDGVQTRIDAVIIRWGAAERTIQMAYIKGTPSASSPQKYQPKRTTSYQELVLGYITVGPSTANIQASAIEDTRNSSTLCGMIANANLIGPIDNETIDDIIV